MDRGELEAEYEGTVSGYPGSNAGGPRGDGETRPTEGPNSTASISVTRSAQGVFDVKFSVDQGRTCQERPGEFGLSGSGPAHADFNGAGGRWAFPGGFNPENCPGVSSE